ncbi:MAG: hypothetical protein ACKVQC_01625 [Elusimicrobiota bacterium]
MKEVISLKQPPNARIKLIIWTDLKFVILMPLLVHMKLRCELHLSETPLKVILVPKSEEKLDHLGLKLAAVTMFHLFSPVVEPSSDHPALYDLDVKPDVFILNEAGEIAIWIECGEVSLNKLDKLSRRFGQMRLIVLKKEIRESERLRKTLTEETRHGARIEIWTWPEGRFNEWLKALEEKIEIFGEAHEKSFNLVINNHSYAVDLLER